MKFLFLGRRLNIRAKDWNAIKKRFDPKRIERDRMTIFIPCPICEHHFRGGSCGCTFYSVFHENYACIKFLEYILGRSQWYWGFTLYTNKIEITNKKLSREIFRIIQKKMKEIEGMENGQHRKIHEKN